MLRRLTCAVLLGLAGFLGACTDTSEPSFSTRNAQVELDLHSAVRLQSNELLGMAQQLQTLAQAGFNAPKKLTKELDKTATQVDQIQMNIPTLLASQDVEIAELRHQLRKGLASKTMLSERTKEIAQYRKALLTSLNASAVRTGATLSALQATNLTRQEQRTGALHNDLNAVRSMIEMQL